MRLLRRCYDGHIRSGRQRSTDRGEDSDLPAVQGKILSICFCILLAFFIFSLCAFIIYIYIFFFVPPTSCRSLFLSISLSLSISFQFRSCESPPSCGPVDTIRPRSHSPYREKRRIIGEYDSWMFGVDTALLGEGLVTHTAVVVRANIIAAIGHHSVLCRSRSPPSVSSSVHSSDSLGQAARDDRYEDSSCHTETTTFCSRRSRSSTRRVIASGSGHRV